MVNLGSLIKKCVPALKGRMFFYFCQIKYLPAKKFIYRFYPV